MASIASFSFSALGQSDRSSSFAPSPPLESAILICRRRRFPRRSLTSTSLRIHCMSTVSDAPPPVSETKSNFLKAYKRPIPSIYNTVLQELIVQQHLMRYKKTYSRNSLTAVVGVPRRKPSLLICHSALNAKCSEGQTQTVTRESPTITQAPVHSKEKSPDLDDGGAGFPPRDDGDGGGGGGGGGNWSGGFFFFGFLAFLGLLKDKEGEEEYRGSSRR